MEELIDLESWFNEIKLPAVEYVATYDVTTGKVKSVGPKHAFAEEEHKLDIDSETAERIIDGSIQISSCVIDVYNNSLEIAEVKNIFKIDDVLHRIISSEYAEFLDPDIILTYSDGELTISLSDQFRSRRKVHWSGDTVMNFLITDYNDPNILYNMVTLTVSDLVDDSVKFTNLDMPTKFSVYTRRLFKNYVIEYK